MIDERAPAHATTEASGWTSTAIVAGVAAGAAVAIGVLLAAGRRRTLAA